MQQLDTTQAGQGPVKVKVNAGIILQQLNDTQTGQCQCPFKVKVEVNAGIALQQLNDVQTQGQGWDSPSAAERNTHRSMSMSKTTQTGMDNAIQWVRNCK